MLHDGKRTVAWERQGIYDFPSQNYMTPGAFADRADEMALHAARAARQAWKARGDNPVEPVDGACDGQTQKRRRVTVKWTANVLDVQDVSLVEPPF